MPGWMIDNRNTKLASILQEQLQGSPELSLLLKKLSLSGFSALYEQLKSCKSRLLLAIDDQPLSKRLAVAVGEEVLQQDLEQKRRARQLLAWLQANASVKGIASGRLPNNLYHFKGTSRQAFVQGSSALTAAGLGLVYSDQLDMNMGSDDLAQAQQMLQWFDQHWQDSSVVNIQNELIEAASFLASDQPAELIYFLVLYRLFQELLTEIDEDAIVKSKTGIK